MDTPQSEERSSWTDALALNRTVLVVLASVLFFGLGEEMWAQFLPVYLHDTSKEAARAAQVGGGVTLDILLTVGIYSCLRNVFEGFCYIGGGQLTARFGDRGSLMLFGALTVSGYVLFFTSDHAAVAIVAALLILGWEPLSVPVTFTTVGSTVKASQQGMAFAIQSIQKRLPKMLGPLLAGFVLSFAVQTVGDVELGRVWGMHLLVAGALGLGLASLFLQFRYLPHRKPSPQGQSAWSVLRNLPPALKRLLLAEVFTRWCDWLVRDFVVLYIVVQLGIDAKWYGLLVALQSLVALVTYLPIGGLTRTVGLQPFIGLTFIFFALFPLVLALTPPGPWLVAPFIVNGLREIGEPARKATITGALPEEVRARGVGLYWGVRSFALCSASVVGALLWSALGAQVWLFAAFGLGCVGAAVYYVLCRTALTAGTAPAR
jgi:MFS family permease